MYYSAVVDSTNDTNKLLDVCYEYDINLTQFSPTSFQGSQMLELAAEQGCVSMPVIMIGDTVLSSGPEAWVDLYEHSLANPHVHWEAGDSDEEL